MQIYKKILIFSSISTLKYPTKILPFAAYEKNRILQLFFKFILIKLSTSLHCRKRHNCSGKSVVV